MSERNAEDIAREMDDISKELDDTNYTFVSGRQEKMRVLSARRDALNIEHKAALDRQSFCTIPVYGWVCFHCGVRCYTQAEATEHFGALPTAKPQCSQGETEAQRAAFRAAVVRAILEVDGPVMLRPEIQAQLAKQGWDRLDKLIDETYGPAKLPLLRDAQGFTATDRAIIADDPT